MTAPQARAGIHEFVFGALASERDGQLRFWRQLGFECVAEGSLDASRAAELYRHPAALTSLLLEHPGCRGFGTGFVGRHIGYS